MKAFAAEDAHVHFTYNTHADEAQKLAKDLDLPTPIAMQLGDTSSVTSAFETAEKDGPIDILVNNAVQWRPEDGDNAASAYFDTNINGPLHLTSLFVKENVAKRLRGLYRRRKVLPIWLFFFPWRQT